mmetsp:Transcript_4775/g.11312  ORF Transcript_4775/g.11312 Transcript_4775/m.11312 type:complete len:207 (+) Transcript_4775:801-1421(+)
MFSHVPPRLVNHNGGIPNGLFLVVSLKNRAHDDHLMLSSQFRDKMETVAAASAFCEFHPRCFFSGAKKERTSPTLLEAKYVCSSFTSNVNDLFDALEDGISLLQNRGISWSHNCILDSCNFNPPWRAGLFRLGFYRVGFKINISLLCCLGGLINMGSFELLESATVKDSRELALLPLISHTRVDNRLNGFNLAPRLGNFSGLRVRA